VGVKNGPSVWLGVTTPQVWARPSSGMSSAAPSMRRRVRIMATPAWLDRARIVQVSPDHKDQALSHKDKVLAHEDKALNCRWTGRRAHRDERNQAVPAAGSLSAPAAGGVAQGIGRHARARLCTGLPPVP